MEILKNMALFPLKVVWGVLMWPLKSLHGLFFGRPARERIGLVNFEKPERSISSVHEEIDTWYRSKGKDASRDIHEMLADILEPGTINMQDWEVLRRSDRPQGLPNNMKYVGKNPQYTNGKRKLFRYAVKEFSLGPVRPNALGDLSEKKIKNHIFEKGFKPQAHERIYKTEEELNKAEAEFNNKAVIAAKHASGLLGTINDCDDLNRNMVLINPYDQEISLRILGESYHKSKVSGILTGKLLQLNSESDSRSFCNGDIVSIKESDITEAIGHYTIVESSQNFLILDREACSAWNPLGLNRIAKVKFHVSKPSASHDGVTLQVLYSFLSEEWRSLQEDDIDLMQFTFPLTMITREQAILGGVNGDASSAWSFADDNGSKLSPRKLIRTGGWQEQDAKGNIVATYSGIITLGTMDKDTQVEYSTVIDGYFKPFSRTGPVNEAIKIDDPSYLEIRIVADRSSWVDSSSDELSRINDSIRLSCLSTVTLEHIGVTIIEALANRFPLSDYKKSQDTWKKM